MKKGLIALGVVILLVIAISGFVIKNYNTIVALHEAMDGAWSQVENQLQRRFDLIPNLINTVKGYAAHEKEIFTYVADARAKLAGARTIPEKIEASQGLERALGRLLLIVERYPELKANETFCKLMDELAGTENRIAVERRRYNETVKGYNMTIRRFPARFFASMFGFERATYFEVEERSREVPKVEF
ncbi:MAG: LemA family protein [bacterium]|nr:LemA family protein [bacterium]